jgi:hypothetical protein
MTKTKLHAPGSADIPLTLDGEEVFLKPTLDACLGISRLHNAPITTAGKITDMDFDTILMVLALGLGVEPNKKLQEKLYRTGVLFVRDPLIKFVHVVNNGGRPVFTDPIDDDEDETDPS